MNKDEVRGCRRESAALFHQSMKRIIVHIMNDCTVIKYPQDEQSGIRAILFCGIK